MNCDICGLNFCTAAERMIHYLNTPECKVSPTISLYWFKKYQEVYHVLILYFRLS